MSLTPEQIAEIASKAALAAVSAALSGNLPAAAPGDDAGELGDADKEVIKADNEHAARDNARAAELARELIPLILQPRHLETFNWMAGGGEAVRVVQIAVRNAVQKALPDYREAMGKGGSSSRDLASLSERIPVNK